MGKLSLYRSRRNVSKKGKGRPKKYAMPLKTKDIDTTLSYESSSDCDEYKDGETSNSFKVMSKKYPRRVKNQIHFNVMHMKLPTRISKQTLV